MLKTQANMEVKFDDGELFKKIIGAIRELSDEVEFFCTEDTMEIQAMDGSHVCLIDMILKKSAFSTYKLDQDISIGVNLTSLNTLLKMSKKNDSVAFKHPKDTDALELKIAGSKKKLDFNLKLMEIEQERLETMEFPYDRIVTLDSSEFEKLIKNATSIGDSCDISITENSLDFKITGDTGSGTLSTEDVTIEKFVPESDYQPIPQLFKFNSNHLKNIAKASKLTDKVTLKIMENAPLCCNYDLGEDIGHVRFYIAPMADEDIPTATEDEN